MNDMVVTSGKTKGQVFCSIFQRMAEQGGLSCCANGCAYFDPDGRRCAVGWLLPQGLPDRIDFWAVQDLLENLGGALGPNEEFIATNAELLTHMQVLHDRAEEPGDSSFEHSAAVVLDAHPECREYLHNWVQVARG